MRIAERMEHIRESGTARIARITAIREAQGARIIRLNIGEPNFDTPEFITKAANKAMSEGQTRYTDVAGTAALRAAAAEKFRRDNGISCTPDQIVIGNGAKQLIFNALLATVGRGDEVIVPVPSWVSYPDITKIAGARPVIISGADENEFKMTAAQLAKAITEHTRWVILNSPCNPTGSVLTESELRDFADVLRDAPGVAVLSDDIYEKMTFDGEQFTTFATVAPDLCDRVLTVNGVSKSHAMTGWRIGFAVGPRDLIAAMIKLQGQSTTNPSSISQAAALAALTQTEESERFTASCRAAYQRRRDRLVTGLSSIPGLQCTLPRGAFYVFASCQDILGRTTPDGIVLCNDTAFCEYLLRDHGVSTVPGSEFGGAGFFRLSFATDELLISEACHRIQRAVENLT